MTRLPPLSNIIRFLFTPSLLFTYLAVPPILVMFDVPKGFGLAWAFSIFFMTLFACTASRDSAWKRYLLFTLLLVFTVLNMGLAISFFVQGTAFNTAFFTHLDMSTVRIAFATDRARFIGVLLYLFAAPIVFKVTFRHASEIYNFLRCVPIPLRWITLILALITNYPLQAMVLHKYTSTLASQRLLDEIDTLKDLRQINFTTSAATKNLVLIYMESLEKNYMDDSLFPGLTPNMTKLKDKSTWFDNVHQFPGTNWTIGGIVSSQCGVPLLTDGHGNRILASLDNPFRQITCLAEFLKENGYQTVYLGGASLDFAGKGNFLSDNGYDILLGLEELPSSTRHKWGLFDDQLFNHADKLLNSLAASEQPFLLTILTLDTHHPFGNASPSCARYLESDDTMLNAVYCTDQLIGDFLDQINQSEIADNTVVALVSDHLLIMGDVEKKLETKERRLTFALIEPQKQPVLYKGASTHFDIAPTMLEAIGIPDANFVFGHSLLSEPEGKAFIRGLTKADFKGFKIEELVHGAVLTDGIIYHTNSHKLSIGDTVFITKSGDHKNINLFAGRDEDGFLALLFDSTTDRYPTLFNTPDDLRKIITTVETGVVVAAANGVSICLADRPCTDKHYVMAYNLGNNRSIVKESSEILNISSDEINAILSK